MSSQGVQITAGKVHVPFKTEILGAMASEKFQKRPPHLVGILATKKEDARTYAEVREGGKRLLSRARLVRAMSRPRADAAVHQKGV
jgi:hypothetical protein